MLNTSYKVLIDMRIESQGARDSADFPPGRSQYNVGKIMNIVSTPTLVILNTSPYSRILLSRTATPRIDPVWENG